MNNDRNINDLRFNQDQGCFVCSLENGIRIYNVEPLVEKSHYDVEAVGSISRSEMLHRTNLLALVPGGSRPKYSDNVLLIYDDLAKKNILQLIFPTSIKSVRLRRDRLIVALLTQIDVFSFPSPIQKLYTLNTARNPRGICEVTPLETADNQVLLYPGYKTGSVQIVDLLRTESTSSRAPVWIEAHEADVAYLAINQQGTKIATASERGTIVRVFDLITRTKLLQLRRGSDTARIHCMNFSPNSVYLCCSSDKGTIHIFAIKEPNCNKQALLSTIMGDGNSHRAMTTFTVQHDCASICAFTSDNAVIAICGDGTFHKYIFNSNGMCTRKAYDVFLDVHDDNC